MTRISTGRLIGGAAIIAAALAAAWIADAPLSAGFLGVIGGAIATLVAWPGHFFPEAAAAEREAATDSGVGAGEVMSALAEPMLLLRSGRVLIGNPAAKALLGDWIEGHDARLAIRHPATVERLAAPGGGGEVEQVEVMGIGQADRHWLMTIARLDQAHRLVRLTDRSEGRAAERMRVNFVANASHELRTPLATVLGFIETLLDDAAGGDPALRRRFLGIMQDEARRMQVLIEDLMSLSRIEAERFSPPREPVDLVPLVEEIRAGCERLLAERGNSIKVENESADTLVPGDRSQLLQLLRNLVTNAVKYGRRDSEVVVRLEDAGPQSIRLSVTDRGEGIAPEHLPRLTERFYRVDSGRSRAEGGTGLGLAIVKHIVGRHRGRLDIRSKVGEGTSVQVLLPRLGEERAVPAPLPQRDMS
jgi:two-component system phosphate regulon sensor histidine kinase PhoR